jgi:hypothetical protein
MNFNTICQLPNIDGDFSAYFISGGRRGNGNSIKGSDEAL